MSRALGTYGGWGRFATRAGLLLVILGVAGCGRGTDDLRVKVEEIKARKGAPLEPLPVPANFEVFEYKAHLEQPPLRDPFSPSIDEPAGTTEGEGPDMNRVKEPLESFPLDALDMVGTLGLVGSMTALVKDPDGVIHRIREGNYAGQSYGRVTAVHEDRIEFVELIPNGAGGWIERPAAIALDDE